MLKVDQLVNLSSLNISLVSKNTYHPFYHKNVAFNCSLINYSLLIIRAFHVYYSRSILMNAFHDIE